MTVLRYITAPVRNFIYNDGNAPWNLKRDRAMQAMLACFFLLLAGQGLYWNYSRVIMPELAVVPDVPGERTVRALSFGDDEAFFRLLALNIQMSGDTFGRFTALYKYDYNRLYHWFHLLTGLNNQSNYLPAMASYYFSQTQNRADVHYIVDYLDEYTDGRPKEKWWWITQAVYLAQHKMDDLDRALALALRLQGVQGIPMWAQQMPAFIHEKRGEFGDALAIIEDILKNKGSYTKGELNFMRYFIGERLNKMDQVKKELDEIEREKDQIPDTLPGQQPPDDVGAPSMNGYNK